MIISAINSDLILINLTEKELLECEILDYSSDESKSTMIEISKCILNQLIYAMKVDYSKAAELETFLGNGKGELGFHANIINKQNSSATAIVITDKIFQEHFRQMHSSTVDEKFFFCLQSKYPYKNSLNLELETIAYKLNKNKIDINLTVALNGGLVEYFGDFEFISRFKDNADIASNNSKNDNQRVKVLDVSEHNVQDYLSLSAPLVAIATNKQINVKVVGFSLGIKFTDWDKIYKIINLISDEGITTIYKKQDNKYLIVEFDEIELLSAVQICNLLIEFDNSNWLTKNQISTIKEHGGKLLNHSAIQELKIFM